MFDPIQNAQAALGRAAAHVRAWHARQTTPESTYVSHGHDAIAAIDATIRYLHDARSALVSEIHRDDIERAARVDQLLAEIRAGLVCGPGATIQPVPHGEEPESGTPVPPGVQGFGIAGRYADGGEQS